MEKYKVSFLPTSKSRKMKTLFVYASSIRGAVIAAKIEITRLYPDGTLVSIQGADREFIDLKEDTK